VGGGAGQDAEEGRRAIGAGLEAEEGTTGGQRRPGGGGGDDGRAASAWRRRRRGRRRPGAEAWALRARCRVKKIKMRGVGG